MNIFTYIVIFASIIVAILLSELITKDIIKTNKKWIVRVLVFVISLVPMYYFLILVFVRLFGVSF